MFDPNKPYGTVYGAGAGVIAQNGKLYTIKGVPLEPETEDVAPEVEPSPKEVDPPYAATKKPKVYITQMNLRQLRDTCIQEGIAYAPGDRKKALIAKIREARK